MECFHVFLARLSFIWGSAGGENLSDLFTGCFGWNWECSVKFQVAIDIGENAMSFI